MADLSMTSVLLTAFGSILAGGATGWLTARIKAKHDLESWERSRRAMVSESAVALLRETVTAIAAAGHAGCWLTWKASCDPGSLTADDVKHYDETMHDLLPKILGGQAAIGTFCPEAAEKVMGAVEAISARDVEIGRACIAWRAGDAGPLGDQHPQALASYDEARTLCAGLGANLLAGSATH